MMKFWTKIQASKAQNGESFKDTLKKSRYLPKILITKIYFNSMFESSKK